MAPRDDSSRSRGSERTCRTDYWEAAEWPHWENRVDLVGTFNSIREPGRGLARGVNESNDDPRIEGRQSSPGCEDRREEIIKNPRSGPKRPTGPSHTPRIGCDRLRKTEAEGENR